MGDFLSDIRAAWPTVDRDLRRCFAKFEPAPCQPEQFESQTASSKEPHVLARNIASGHIGSREADWLRSGFSTWLGTGGTLQLDRCLRLPSSQKKLARAERDRHLREAWDLLDEPHPWRKSVALADEIRRFEVRIWPAWKSHQAPPQGASELRRLLFMAMRSGALMPSTVQQVNNICNPDS